MFDNGVNGIAVTRDGEHCKWSGPGRDCEEPSVTHDIGSSFTVQMQVPSKQ